MAFTQRFCYKTEQLAFLNEGQQAFGGSGGAETAETAPVPSRPGPWPCPGEDRDLSGLSGLRGNCQLHFAALGS